MIWAPGIEILRPSLELSAEKVLEARELLKLPEALAFQKPNPPLALKLVLVAVRTACAD